MRGYIYCLINPSMEGVTKIGKTTRNPQNRVEELSSATGVPTPFILVYQEEFSDCDAAEKMIHEVLQSKNQRVSKNREFFNTPVYEVINLIRDIKKNIGSGSVDNSEIILPLEYVENSRIENDFYEEAQRFFYGLGDTIQDYKSAFTLFKKSATFGHSESLHILGIMLLKGKGCRKNVDLALEYLKKGVNQGYYLNYALMALIFSTERSVLDLENSKKCWKKFFESCEDSLTDKELMYIFEFFCYNVAHKLTDSKEIFVKYKNELFSYINMRISMESSPNASDKQKIQKANEHLIANYNLNIELNVTNIEELVVGKMYLHSNPNIGAMIYKGISSYNHDIEKKNCAKFTYDSINTLLIPYDNYGILINGIKAFILRNEILFYKYLKNLLDTYDKEHQQSLRKANKEDIKHLEEKAISYYIKLKKMKNRKLTVSEITKSIEMLDKAARIGSDRVRPYLKNIFSDQDYVLEYIYFHGDKEQEIFNFFKPYKREMESVKRFLQTRINVRKLQLNNEKNMEGVRHGSPIYLAKQKKVEELKNELEKTEKALKIIKNI